MKKISDVFKNILKEVYSDNNECNPRGLKIKELINYKATIENPINLTCDFEDRKVSWKYLTAELLRYLSGDLHSVNIGKYASLRNKISDEFGGINSNYGHIVLYKYYQDYDNQYNFIIETLKSDKDSRQALIRYNSQEHVYKDNKDFPCTISNQFLIRNNKLNMIINMRSNDAFRGFQYDIIRFGLLLQSIRLDLLKYYPDLELGVIYHNAGSMHIYESMFEKTCKILLSEPICDYKIILQKSFIDIKKIVIKNEEIFRNILEDCKDYKQFIKDYLFIDIENE